MLPPPTAHGPRRRAATILSLLVGSAIVLGGGGSPSPIAELLLQLVTAGLAIAWLALVREAARPAPAIGLMVCLVLLLPILQLVPLPPAVWQSLPGREAARAAYDLAGQGNAWQPLSLAPARTLSGLLALGPPLVVMIMAASLPLHHRWIPLVAVAAGGFATVALGAAQLAAGHDTALRLYKYTHVGWLTGFQANRNATIDILLIATMAFAAAAFHFGARRGATRVRWFMPVGIALLVIGGVLTGSRAGIALILPVLLVVVAISGVRFSRRTLLAGLAGLGVIGALGILAARFSAPVKAVVARFGLANDFRAELWADTFYNIGLYWPWGGGLGSFMPLTIATERLEVVDYTVPNRAHNDYLEFVLEGGIPAIAVMAIGALLLVTMAVRSWRDRDFARAQILFAFGTLGTIAAHSLVDYPLRSMSLACLFGLACGMLSRPRHHNERMEHR